MGTWTVLAVVPWLGLWLATFPPQVALAPPVTCTKGQCLANPNAMSKPLAACCRLKLGCPCQHHPECDHFEDRIVPLNVSFYADFATLLCTCKRNRKLVCVRKPCPVMPMDCKNVLTPMDGCVMCRDKTPPPRKPQ